MKNEKKVFLLDEDENILEEKVVRSDKEAKDWFRDSYCEVMSGDGDDRFPDENEVEIFLDGFDVNCDFDNAIDDEGNTEHITRIWRYIS